MAKISFRGNCSLWSRLGKSVDRSHSQREWSGFRRVVTALLWTLAIAAAALAQDHPPENAPPPGSISGTVTDAGTGAPMGEVEVSLNRSSRGSMSVKTDAQGHYSIRGVDPGNYRVTAQAPAPTGRGFGAYATRQIVLRAAQDLGNIDFHLASYASVTGKVVDQNREPVTGITVFLVAREYSSGVLRSFFVSGGSTDDRGQYIVQRATPGRAYYLVAMRLDRNLEAISNAPLDPKLRRPAVIPTFYPNGAKMADGQAIVLGPGEHREGADIQLVRTPSYCVEAVLEGASGPSDLRFEIREGQPTSGQSGDGGFFIAEPGGNAGADGKVRICNLHPGQYELSATEFGSEPRSPASLFGSMALNIVDEDLKGLRLVAHPRIAIPGEVVWDGPAPVDPPSVKLNISVQPITHSGEAATFNGADAQLPGDFTMPGLLVDDYSMRINRVPTGMYVKDIVYGGHSVLNQVMRPGSATTNDPKMRVVIARDGGTVAARVADKDGNPSGDTPVVVIPASADSEAMLAATMINGRTDQYGAYTSSTVPPGKYYVLAPEAVVDKSPECVDRLWRARTSAAEVEVPPNGSGAATLTPKRIE